MEYEYFDNLGETNATKSNGFVLGKGSNLKKIACRDNEVYYISETPQWTTVTLNRP
jgi:hypothetical protein